MAKLTTKRRNKLKSSTFGMPKERKYPMPDKSHAKNAKARATQMVKRGKLSVSEKEKIDRKANKILGERKDKKEDRKEKVKSRKRKTHHKKESQKRREDKKYEKVLGRLREG